MIQNNNLTITATILVINELIIDPIPLNKLTKNQINKLPGQIMKYYEEVAVDLDQINHGQIKQFQKYLFRQIHLLKPGDWLLYCGHTQNQKIHLGKIIQTKEELIQRIMLLTQQNLGILFTLERNPQSIETIRKLKSKVILADGHSQLSPNFHKQRINQIVFDAQGQVITDRFGILSDRPNYKIYPVDKEPVKFCRFCRRQSSEADISERCGPMYGPIKVSRDNIYVHELCAKWTPEIYQDDNNKFVNLKQAIKRCDTANCYLCTERGGGLGCCVESCEKQYHYLCAEADNCLKTSSWLIYCKDHKEMAPKEARDEEKEYESESEEGKIGSESDGLPSKMAPEQHIQQDSDKSEPSEKQIELIEFMDDDEQIQQNNDLEKLMMMD